ncbi:hypothetical protein A176_004761 [Myxococcus hansupus]|uniref:Uncharacterized protein n=1 Tax=Pseudomyxococcus hansupus TaxID=1297742 RepID=A0A0H4WYH0_9BACT|nr:hypothetical protein A176_004761 [Myxococcus hansupus]
MRGFGETGTLRPTAHARGQKPHHQAEPALLPHRGWISHCTPPATIRVMYTTYASW